MLGREFREEVSEHVSSTGEEIQGISVVPRSLDRSKHLETARMRLCDVWADFVNLRAEDYSERRWFHSRWLFHEVTVVVMTKRIPTRNSVNNGNPNLTKEGRLWRSRVESSNSNRNLGSPSRNPLSDDINDTVLRWLFYLADFSLVFFEAFEGEKRAPVEFEANSAASKVELERDRVNPVNSSEKPGSKVWSVGGRGPELITYDDVASSTSKREVDSSCEESEKRKGIVSRLRSSSNSKPLNKDERNGCVRAVTVLIP
nr:putative CCA tRNA nucleotidyltransferase 2 [Ipomoea batatas]